MTTRIGLLLFPNLTQLERPDFCAAGGPRRTGVRGISWHSSVPSRLASRQTTREPDENLPILRRAFAIKPQ